MRNNDKGIKISLRNINSILPNFNHPESSNNINKSMPDIIKYNRNSSNLKKEESFKDQSFNNILLSKDLNKFDSFVKARQIIEKDNLLKLKQ